MALTFVVILRANVAVERHTCTSGHTKRHCGLESNMISTTLRTNLA